MNQVYNAKKALQEHIIYYINNIVEENQKKMMEYLFYGDEEKLNWGSLSRGSLILLLTYEGTEQLILARSIEMIHHASLIVDDMIDKAHIRRGKESFWIKYGKERGILFSQMLVMMAFNDLFNFDPAHIKGIQAHNFAYKAMKHMADSELESSLKSIDNLEFYLNCIKRKTGSLYVLVGELANLIPSKIVLDERLLITALEAVGISHQMLDDFKDSDLSQQDDQIFKSNKAKEKNWEKSIYKLLEHGFTRKELKTLHNEWSCKAISQLDEVLCNSAVKEQIVSLCKMICLGSIQHQ